MKGRSRSVLVVEDDALLRDLVARSLEGAGLTVETAATAADAKRAFVRMDPDAAVIDVELGPGPNGFDLATALRDRAPHLAVVFLTNLPDPRFAARGSDEIAGPVSYLRKSQLTDVATLLDALDATMRGSRVGMIRHDIIANRPLAHLTRKQVDVLRLIAEGQTNAQIARERGITAKAVEDTIGRIASALHIESSDQVNLRVAIARRYLDATGGRPGADVARA